MHQFRLVPLYSVTIAQPLTTTNHIGGPNRHDGNKAVWPILWPGGTGENCCQIHNPSVCLSWLPSFRNAQSCQTSLLCCVCSAPNKASSIRHFRCSRSPTSAKSSISFCSRVVWASSVYLCLYDLLESDVRRYVLEQVVVYSGSRDVYIAGDQSDGEGDVQLPRLGADSRWTNPVQFWSGCPEGFQRDSAELPELSDRIRIKTSPSCNSAIQRLRREFQHHQSRSWFWKPIERYFHPCQNVGKSWYADERWLARSQHTGDPLPILFQLDISYVFCVACYPSWRTRNERKDSWGGSVSSFWPRRYFLRCTSA